MSVCRSEHNTPTAYASRSRASVPAYHRVRRTRTLLDGTRTSGLSLTQREADATDRVELAALRTRRRPSPQPCDVHVDHVCRAASRRRLSSQTSRASTRGETMWPGGAAVSELELTAVNSNPRSARVTVRVTRSMSRSASLSRSASPRPLRISARIRASSSANANASPDSRRRRLSKPSTRSSTASRLVRSAPGVATPRCRNVVIFRCRRGRAAAGPGRRIETLAVDQKNPSSPVPATATSKCRPRIPP